MNDDPKQHEEEQDNQNDPPSVTDQQAISGTLPDPESDDDTLQNAQAVGLQLEEDEEHPKPLNIGSDITKAEEHHRTS